MNSIFGPGLGESQRLILESLKHKGEATLTNLEEEIPLARETLRDHLKVLMGLGLAMRLGVRRSGPGRPEVRYGLSSLGEELFPNREGELLRELVTYLVRSGHQGLLKEFFEARVESQREDLQGQVRDLEAGDRLVAVAEILTEQGLLANVTGSETSPPRLRICHCPLCGVVDVCQLPCQAERALLSDLLGADLERETFMPNGDTTCTYVVTFPTGDSCRNSGTPTLPRTTSISD